MILKVCARNGILMVFQKLRIAFSNYLLISREVWCPVYTLLYYWFNGLCLRIVSWPHRFTYSLDDQSKILLGKIELLNTIEGKDKSLGWKLQASYLRRRIFVNIGVRFYIWGREQRTGLSVSLMGWVVLIIRIVLTTNCDIMTHLYSHQCVQSL